MTNPFEPTNTTLKIVCGFLVMIIALAVPFLGRDSYFGYNDRHYLLVGVIALPLIVYGAGLLGRAIIEMSKSPFEPKN